MFVESFFNSTLPYSEEIHRTDAFLLTVSESRTGEAPYDAPVQSRSCQYSRRGTRTLEEEVCALDPSPSFRRERGGEGEVERDDGSEGSGRMGESANAGLKESEGRLSSSVFVDTNGMTEAEIYWKDYSFNNSYYERQYDWFKEPLGYEEDDSDTPTTYNVNERHCFNCGSTEHEVRTCPEPINRPLISLSRSMFQFLHPESSEEPERLYVVEEWKSTRLKWVDEFSPGEIRNTALRDALGLRPEDPGEDLPWLYAMLDWGYPKGWFSVEDPRKVMRERIIYGLGEEDGEGENSFLIYEEGVEELDISSHVPQEKYGISGAKSPSSTEHNEEQILRRWASYRTTLFNPDILPIFNGKPLPPLGSVAPTSRSDTESTFTPDREALWASIVSGQFFLEKGKAALMPKPSIEPKPPWRLPGAFNWIDDARFVFTYESSSPPSFPGDSALHVVEEDEEDMDLSD